MATASDKARISERLGAREAESRGTEPTQRPLQYWGRPEGNWQSKAQGHELVDYRNRQKPQEASTNPEERVYETHNIQVDGR